MQITGFCYSRPKPFWFAQVHFDINDDEDNDKNSKDNTKYDQ